MPATQKAISRRYAGRRRRFRDCSSSARQMAPDRTPRNKTVEAWASQVLNEN